MLEAALKHKDELQRLYLDACYDSTFQYYWCTSYRNLAISIPDSDWESLQFAVVDADKVVGFVSAHIDRDSDSVSSVKCIHFTKGDEHLFASAVREFFRLLMERFRKINWTVAVGNPAEANYDDLIVKVGGRIVGTYEKHYRRIDGSYADSKAYEWMRPGR